MKQQEIYEHDCELDIIIFLLKQRRHQFLYL